MRSIYFDSLGGPDINPLHGQGYVDQNGELQTTTPVLAMREALKRFYIMMWQHYGSIDDFDLFIHGGSSVPPVLSFAHAHLSGEQFICAPRRVDRHYTDIIPDDEWIAVFRGRQWGVVGVFLPELTRTNSAYVLPTQEMMAKTLLYDIPVVAAFCAQGEAKLPRIRMTEFGMQNMRFVECWDNDQVLSSSAAVKIAYYQDMVDHRVLAVLSNDTRSTCRYHRHAGRAVSGRA